MKSENQKQVRIGDIALGNRLPLVFIGGPDSIESAGHAYFMAREMKKICEEVDVPFIFKASYDKANRTSVKSFRGVGISKALTIYQKIKKELGIPVTADFHTAEEAKKLHGTVDVLQVPALLSRQTDLLVAAGKTGAAVNVKKGQFIAPHDVAGIIGKVESTGNTNILLTERGFTFGYNNIVADMRSLEIMKRFGYPVIFDASHTVQFPSSKGGVSGGDSSFIFPLSRAAVAVGVAGIFMEVHDNPQKALVDGPNSLPLKDLKKTLFVLKKLDAIVKAKV